MFLDQAGSERRAKAAAHETNGELLPAVACEQPWELRGPAEHMAGDPSTVGDACRQR